MHFLTKGRNGFTILELLIVIAIIIFLAKMMMPRYQQLYAKTRQTEISLNLSALYAAQQAFQLQHGRFAKDFKELEWQPRGYTGVPATTTHTYSYGCGGGQEGVLCFTGSSMTSTAHLTGGHLSPQQFIVKAALTNNDKTEVWRIDSGGEIVQEK